MHTQTDNFIPTGPGGQRNAPHAHTALSLAVDTLQWAADEARAASCYPLADELDTLRERAVSLVMRTWRGEGVGR